MKRLMLLSLVLLFVLHSEVLHAEGIWKRYLDVNEIRSVESGKNYIWCATAGGLVGWNKQDGSSINYTQHDNLLSNDVSHLMIDDHNNLWIGYSEINGAVTCYDGSKWKVYDFANSTLPDTKITAMFTDSSGTVWLGTAGAGLVRFNGTSWDKFDAVKGIDQVRDMAVDSDGVIWFATRSGILRFDGSTWNNYNTEINLKIDMINTIFKDDDGVLWFGSQDGIIRYDGELWITYTKEDGLVDPRVTSLTKEDKNTLWIGTKSGVSHFDGTNWTSYKEKDGLIDNFVAAIAVDGNNNKWFCHGDAALGVSVFDGNDWTWYTTWDSGLSSNLVETVVSDSDGVIWLGTEKGLARYDGISWKTYTVRDGLAENHVAGLLVDDTNAVWIRYNPSDNAGVTRYNGTEWRTFSENDGLAHNAVTAIAQSPEGSLVVNTQGSISTFDGSTWETVSKDTWLQSPTISGITQDNSGVMWFGTDHGLARFDGEKWVTYTPGDSISTDDFTNVVASGNGIIRSVTVDGDLVSFDNGTFILHPIEKTWESYSYSITTIAFDDHGIIWTDAVALDVYDQDDTVSLFVFDGISWSKRSIGLTDNGPGMESITDIVIDNEASIWFGTEHGLKHFDGASLTSYVIDAPMENRINDIAVDASNRKIFATSGGVFTYDDGAWKQLTDISVRSLAVDQQDVQWYVTPGGIQSFDSFSWKSFTRDDGLISNSTRVIAVDHNNTKWIGTLSGASSFDGTTWKSHVIGEHLYSDFVRTLAVDADNIKWFGNGLWAELWSYDGSNWTHFPQNDGLPLRRIYALAVDNNNVKWIGTHYELVSFDGVSMKSYTVEDGLVSNRITALAVDNANTVWVGTRDGVSRFDGESWITYTVEDGLVNNFITSIAVDHNNVTWFGTSAGISSFDARSLSDSGDTPHPLIIRGNYPNPFNTSTTVEFDLSAWGPVNITVYNIMGQSIRDIDKGRIPAGIHRITWDGHDRNGNPVSSGVYFFRIKTAGHHATGRMMFLK